MKTEIDQILDNFERLLYGRNPKYKIPEIAKAARTEAKNNIQQLVDAAVIEARIDENQIRLDRINNFRPKPGQLTSANFGSAGAAMEISGLKNSLEERIQELKLSKPSSEVKGE